MQTSESPEEAFGRAVAYWRNLRHLSQRQLADRLTARGMRADAPAISRIESGARSVRLSEAVLISEALELELEALVSASRSPAQQLHRLRRLATFAMRELEIPLATFLGRLIDVQLILTSHPELIASLTDVGDASAIDLPDDYLDWVKLRIQEIARGRSTPEKMRRIVAAGQAVVVPTIQARDELLDVISLFAAAHVLVDPDLFWSVQPDRGHVGH
jgi:transcriptional regulator with XRE-family HTH domain